MNDYDKRPWYDVYDELAYALYYFNKRYKLHAGKELFYKCMSFENTDYFIQLNPWSEKFKDEWNVSSFDPKILLIFLKHDL